MTSEDTVVRSEFDRILASLNGLPDVTHTSPSTIRNVDFIGTSRTFIVTTYRQRERGDTVFLETTGENGLRLVIPPAVVDAIVRQRDALTTKVRRKIGKASAEERKRRGEPLPFKKGAKA